MKTKLYLIASILLICSTLNAQELQTYDGPYGEGVAQYSFVENEKGQRIIKGRFVYTDSLTIAGRGECVINMTGSYFEDKKSAPWVCSVKGTDNESNETVTGPYKDGLKMGLWTHRITIGDQDIKVAEASFYRNTFKNAFKYTYTPVEPVGVYKKLVVNGAFDDKGFYHGEWNITYTNMNDVEYEDIMRYQHGVLAYRLKREVATGVELERYDDEQRVNAFFQNIQLPDSNAVVNDVKYGVLKKMTQHEIIVPLMKTWHDTRTVVLGNQYSSSIPTMVVPRGEFNDESYLRCEQEIVLWMETPKGHKEWLEEQRILEEYKANIKKADAALGEKAYEEALTYYKAAANVKKDESYPVGQIPKVEKLIKDRDTKNRLLKSVKNKQQVLKDEQASIVGNEGFIKDQKRLHEAYVRAFDSEWADIKDDHKDVRGLLDSGNEEPITITQLELYEADLTEILLFQNKLKDLIGKDTKDLGKELKKIESPSVIASKIKKAAG